MGDDEQRGARMLRPVHIGKDGIDLAFGLAH
jgi:hypothetical protein